MKIVFILIISIHLWAGSNLKQNMLNMYKNEQYQNVCNVGFDNFSRFNTDEEFISLYAFACLKSDYIDRLSIPMTKLKFSKEARANSAYFSVILMQKKLLYHALVDDYNLSVLNLPTTKYILSKVFDLYTKLGEHKKREIYIFKDEDDERINYKLYLLRDTKLPKMVIEEIYDTITLKRHIYW